MNELGRTFVCSLAQVTLFAAVAATLCATVLRRRPCAAAQVATLGLAGCLALTVTSLCPLPMWWTWERALPSRPEKPANDSSQAAPQHAPRETLYDSANPATAATGPVWQAAWLRDTRHRLEEAMSTSSDPGLRAPGILASTLLVGVVFGLARLAVGLWAVDRCRRSSRPIVDAKVQHLADQLRQALGCRPCVALCESGELGGPATTGWLRPVLLLPAGWRDWDDAELRAVLAHELAHIRHGDFAARVVAGLGLALHLYHPLLHWLAAQLSLQQELAADALASEHAGGRSSYLRALARLALRFDGPSPSWPARAFFSSPRTLMRRIQMLRNKDGSTELPVARGVLTFTLVAVILGASALRSPAREEPSDPMPQKAPPPIAPSSRDKEFPGTPFDPAYIPANAQGFAFYRPAAFFAQPGMQTLAKRTNEQMQEFAAIFGRKGTMALRVEDIDWVLSNVIISPPPEKLHGQASLQMGLRAIRTLKDFDWLKQLRALAPSLEEKHEGALHYYRIPKGSFPIVLGPMELTFVLPDKRTILFGCKKMPSAEANQLPAWHPKLIRFWNYDQLAVVALDCHNLGWIRDYAEKDKDLDANLAEILASAQCLVASFDAAPPLEFGVYAGLASETDIAVIRHAEGRLLTKLQRDAAAANIPDASKNAVSRFLTGLVAGSQYTQFTTDEELAAGWSSHVNANLAELLEALFPENP